MARNKKPLPQGPAQEGMRKALEQLQKLSNSALFQEFRQNPPKSNPELHERIREASESPSAQKMREHLRAFFEKSEERVPSQRKRKRASGAGAKPKLTAEQIERGIAMMFSARVLLSDVPLGTKRACDLLRQTLGVEVSDLTLRRRIINPAWERFRATTPDNATNQA